MRDIMLRSGKWRCRVANGTGRGRDCLELLDPGGSGGKMMAPLPFSWRHLTQEDLQTIAAEPEVRLWLDEHGIYWRIAEVGPETHYPLPLRRPHLVFDSEQAFAGMVERDTDVPLGELTDAELRRYRDRMHDFGGRRCRFRAPAARGERRGAFGD